MSFRKAVPNRQSSVTMVSPFSRQNSFIDNKRIIKQKRLTELNGQQRNRNMLGNDLDKNWFKSIDTENSVLSDNEDSDSLDSVYDSPLIVHSAKTGDSNTHLNTTPKPHRGHLDVDKHIQSKSGDVRYRQQVDDVIRPMTVGPTRDEVKSTGIFGNVPGLYCTQNLNAAIQPVIGNSINGESALRSNTSDPLPPIRPCSDRPEKNAKNTKVHPKEKYFQKSEIVLDTNQTKEDRFIQQTNEEPHGSVNYGTLNEKMVENEVSVTHTRHVSRPRLESYRSITPLSLCDVMSGVDYKSESSSISPIPISISDSEEYDTDIDLDPNFGKDVQPAEDFSICQWIYREECKKAQIPPQKHILKGLSTRTLSLRNRSLGPRAFTPLCQALKDNLRVERLNLDGTDITDEGIQPIAEMLLENITICHLNLANNSLSLKASQAISHVIIATANLTHLNLSGNKFGDHSSWFLSSGIGSNTSITHLDLSYNDFGEQAGVLLGTGIARNSKLVVLNLAWNKVCGKGAVAIFQALMVNNTLEVLDISWNGLGYDGAVALSKCMKVNKSLADIDVSNNRLDWRCGFLLAEGLTSNSKIQKLKIGYNPLTTTGCMDVLESVATLESTVSLLDCSGITVVGEADLLAATISRRRKFQFIHGGIVTAHDKVGEKPDREVNPMLRIIEYLRLLGLRPLELMKSFDKSSSFELPRKEFIEQIKKIGVKLKPYEIDALANSVSGKGYNKNVINYRKLSLAVREVVQAERERKMREREEWMQIKSYHENILRKGQLDYSQKSTRLADKDVLRAGMVQAASGVFGGSIESLSSPHRSKVQLSMCSPLESSRSIIYSPQKRKKRTKKRKENKSGRT